jgi:anti-sigma regulatory factor (Ser/Thr protein kinase)
VLEWALRDWAVEADTADNARVVLSEMVTNALTHSLEVFRLALGLHGDHILVEVWDGADGMPQSTTSGNASRIPRSRTPPSARASSTTARTSPR